MRVQRWIRDNFFAGLAVVLPVALSIFLFVWGLERITGGVFNLLERYWLEVPAGEQSPLSALTKLFVRVIILVALFIVTFAIGWLARNIIGKHFIRFGDMLLERIPLFNRIYVTLRQISRSVLSEKSEMFSAVVLIEFPRPGIRSVAFITSRTTGEIQDKTEGEVYTIFVPTSPNPTSGFMIVATEDEFERLDMSVEEGMKMVISGGAVLPERRTEIFSHLRREPKQGREAAPDEETQPV